MITEDYVSFETAKLLKEKGFNAKCDKCYAYFADDDIRLLNLKYPKSAQLLIENRYPCITLQMAMKWLREVHNLHIMVNCIGKVNYDPIVQRFDGKDFEIDGVEVGTTKRINGKWVNVRRGFKSYEAACEAAIKYCLEHLI